MSRSCMDKRLLIDLVSEASGLPTRGLDANWSVQVLDLSHEGDLSLVLMDPEIEPEILCLGMAIWDMEEGTCENPAFGSFVLSVGQAMHVIKAAKARDWPAMLRLARVRQDERPALLLLLQAHQ